MPTGYAEDGSSTVVELDHLPDRSWQRRAELEARVLASLAQAETDV